MVSPHYLRRMRIGVARFQASSSLIFSTLNVWGSIGVFNGIFIFLQMSSIRFSTLSNWGMSRHINPLRPSLAWMINPSHCGFNGFRIGPLNHSDQILIPSRGIRMKFARCGSGGAMRHIPAGNQGKRETLIIAC